MQDPLSARLGKGRLCPHVAGLLCGRGRTGRHRKAQEGHRLRAFQGRQAAHVPLHRAHRPPERVLSERRRRQVHHQVHLERGHSLLRNLLRRGYLPQNRQSCHAHVPRLPRRAAVGGKDEVGR
ncbi:MAG: DUF1989 domain-containing protein [Clostridia bacterium]|nr:DUF1989 domain-containing protein [Clostridia bacterium]